MIENSPLQLPPFPWATLPLADSGMNSQDIANDIVSCLLRIQSGQEINPAHPVIAELLREAVEVLPAASSLNKDLLFHCAAEVLVCEFTPVAPVLENYRRALQLCVRRTYGLFLNPRNILSSDITLNPRHPVTAGAIKYFVQNKRAAEGPAAARLFEEHLRLHILTTPADDNTGFQLLMERRVMRAEQSVQASGQQDTDWLNDLLDPQPGPSGIQQRPSLSSVQVQPGPSGLQPQPGPSGAQAQLDLSSVQVQPGPSGAQAQLDLSSVQVQPGPSGLQPQPGPSGAQAQLDLSSVQVQPGPAGAQPQAGPSGIQPQPTSPAVRNLIYAVAANAGSAWGPEYVTLLYLYLSIWLINRDDDGDPEDDPTSALEKVCGEFQLQMLLGTPQMDQMEFNTLVRQQCARLLAQYMFEKNPIIKKEVLHFYLLTIFAEIFSAGADPITMALTAEYRLGLVMSCLEDFRRLKNPDNRLNAKDPIVQMAIDYLSDKCCKGQDVDKKVVRDATRLLLQASTIPRTRRPLMPAVESCINEVIQTMGEVRIEYPQKERSAQAVACYAHALRLLPRTRKRHLHLPVDLLKSTLVSLVLHISPRYETKSFSTIESNIPKTLNIALNWEETAASCVFLRQTRPGVQGALRYAAQKAHERHPEISKLQILYYAEQLLLEIPVSEMLLPLSSFVDTVCMKVAEALERQHQNFPGMAPEPGYISSMIWAYIRAENEAAAAAAAIPAASSEEDSAGTSSPDASGPAAPASGPAAPAAAPALPRQESTPGRLPERENPETISALELFILQTRAKNLELRPELLRRVLLSLLRNTPQNKLGPTMSDTVQRLADAAMPVLECCRLQYRTFHATGELGAFIIRNLSDAFYSSFGKKDRCYLHSEFYEAGCQGRFIRNGKQHSFAVPGKKTEFEILRLRRMLQYITPGLAMRYFLSLAGSSEGMDYVARAMMTPGAVTEPQIDGFARLIRNRSAYLHEDKIYWDRIRESRLMMTHDYELGICVKNPLTGDDQRIPIAILRFCLEIDLTQALEPDTMPELQVIRISIEPLKERRTES